MLLVPARHSKKGAGHAAPRRVRQRQRRALLPATRGRDGVGANDSGSAPHPNPRTPSSVTLLAATVTLTPTPRPARRLPSLLKFYAEKEKKNRACEIILLVPTVCAC